MEEVRKPRRKGRGSAEARFADVIGQFPALDPVSMTHFRLVGPLSLAAQG